MVLLLIYNFPEILLLGYLVAEQVKPGWQGGNANLITSVAPCDQSRTEKVSLGSLGGFHMGIGFWIFWLVWSGIRNPGTRKGYRPVLRLIL